MSNIAISVIRDILQTGLAVKDCSACPSLVDQPATQPSDNEKKIFLILQDAVDRLRSDLSDMCGGYRFGPSSDDHWSH